MDEDHTPSDPHERRVADPTEKTSVSDDPRAPRSEVGVPLRQEDLEPHSGLRYIAGLFKALSILLVILLIGEFIIGISQEGRSAMTFLMVEATRLIVFAGLLWGAGDIALMLIESNHDLRATRVLVARMAHRVEQLEERLSGRGGTVR